LARAFGARRGMTGQTFAGETFAGKLGERIRRDGPISIADYMNAVTAAYYARGDVFGTAGDFITAPEISQTFGELIGLWCAVMWRNMGAPARFTLVECGPGRGTLMKDLLRAAARMPGFAAAAEIHLVEQSPALKSMQRDALKDHAVTWHGDITGVPAGPMVLVANEFLDALPIRQFQKTPAGWRERFVTVDEHGALAFILKEGTPEAAPQAEPNAIFETSPAIADFVSHICARLAANGGAALLIDYGHAATAAGDTLQAVKEHRPCGIFETPGEADLTAHVDFEAVAAAARACGLAVFGPLAQGTWLSRLGIKLRGLQLAKGKNPEVAREIEQGIRRLTEPEAMGALFKVMALAHPALATPDGFQQDAAP
jgi:NADH dehydrogenase [ubiquinone] 1 alpha subcomplex assembly factor 7